MINILQVIIWFALYECTLENLGTTKLVEIAIANVSSKRKLKNSISTEYSTRVKSPANNIITINGEERIKQSGKSGRQK